MSIEIQPTNLFPIDSEINFNCKLPQSNDIWWTTNNDHSKQSNPLILRIGIDYIDKKITCHAKDLNGKLYKKIIQIQTYSDEELMAVIHDNEMERSLQNNLPNTPKIHIKLLTSPADIKASGIVQLHCFVEGI